MNASLSQQLIMNTVMNKHKMEAKRKSTDERKTENIHSINTSFINPKSLSGR